MVDAYLGEIRLFAGKVAPDSWHLCDGALLPIANYNALFALLGTTYGGNGTTNFALPDLRGRLMVGANPSGAGGMAVTNRGNTFGADTVTLTDACVPQHNHLINATTADATTLAPGTSMLLAKPSTGNFMYRTKTSDAETTVTLSPSAIGVAGAGQPPDNHMPSLALNYIIAIEGLYPSA